MKIIEVPVKFLMSDQEELDKYEEMGIKVSPDTEDGMLNINIESICTFNEDDEHHVHLTMSDSRSYTVYSTLSEFKQLLKNV